MFRNYGLRRHPTFGVLGMIATVWFFVEALSPREDNLDRMRMAAKPPW